MARRSRTRREKVLTAVLGPDFIVSIHEEANRAWVTAKSLLKAPVRKPPPTDDEDGYGW
jgi:hypothetical protein